MHKIKVIKKEELGQSFSIGHTLVIPWVVCLIVEAPCSLTNTPEVFLVFSQSVCQKACKGRSMLSSQSGEQVLSNVLLVLRPLLMSCASVRSLFQKPLPIPTSAANLPCHHGEVTFPLQIQFTASSLRRRDKLGSVQCANRFSSETDRPDWSYETFSSEGNTVTKHIIMKCEESM